MVVQVVERDAVVLTVGEDKARRAVRVLAAQRKLVGLTKATVAEAHDAGSMAASLGSRSSTMDGGGVRSIPPLPCTCLSVMNRCPCCACRYSGLCVQMFLPLKHMDTHVSRHEMVTACFGHTVPQFLQV